MEIDLSTNLYTISTERLPIAIIQCLKFNPDYALGFVMKGLIARKSGYLETEA
jgi:hypothetical protein